MTIGRIFSEILIIFFQVLAGLALVILTTFFFFILDVENMGQFILVLTRLWLCFVAGTYIIGVIAKRLRYGRVEKKWRRLLWTTIGAVIPMVALVITWYILNPVPPEIFEESVLGNWQPILAFSSLAFAITGFALGGGKKEHSV